MKTYYLIPWSVGFECRTTKPEGHSIEVVEKSEYDALINKIKELNELVTFQDVRVARRNEEIARLEYEIKQLRGAK